MERSTQKGSPRVGGAAEEGDVGRRDLVLGRQGQQIERRRGADRDRHDVDRGLGILELPAMAGAVGKKLSVPSKPAAGV